MYSCFKTLTAEIKEVARAQQLQLQRRFGEAVVQMETRLQSDGDSSLTRVPANGIHNFEPGLCGVFKMSRQLDTFYNRRKPLYVAIELMRTQEPLIAEPEIIAYLEGRKQRMKLRKPTEHTKVALT